LFDLNLDSKIKIEKEKQKEKQLTSWICSLLSPLSFGHVSQVGGPLSHARAELDRSHNP
jgi:hypothetical protein